MAVTDGLTLVTVTSTAVVGRYHSDKVDLVLTAQVIGDEVRSNISRPDGSLLTEVAVPNLDTVQGVGIAERVEEASHAAAHRLGALKVSPEELAVLRAVYDDAITKMYNATDKIGRGQIRFALPYHMSIINRVTLENAAAYRAAAPVDGVGTTTTTTTTYTAPPAVPCKEVAANPEIAFHYESDHPATAETNASYSTAPPLASSGSAAAYRWLQGSDWGCCGNYAGNCYYAHWACYAHDWWCKNCDHGWACGPACKPG